MLPYVLLINPWVHDFTAFDLWSKPLGLLYIASILRHSGYRVHLIDCLHYEEEFQVYPKKQKPNGTRSFYYEEIDKPYVFRGIPRRFKRYGMPPQEFLAKLSGLPRPLLVCVTSLMTYWYPGVFEAIRMVKSVFPDVPIALGGIYASLCYTHAKEKSGADYVIQGPGELGVLGLVDRLSQSLTNDEGMALATAKRSQWEDRDYSKLKIYVEEDSLPAYDLYQNLKSVSLLTSRGCPFRCTYCASYLLGPKFVRKEPQRVVEEIEYFINALGVKDIAFYDDALLVNSSSHIIPIIELLIQKGIKARFHTPNGLHPRYIDLSLAKLLWEAGFRTIRLGFEGTSSRMQLASTNKVSSQELENAVKCLRLAGYSKKDIGVYLLVGLPGQGVEEVKEAMEFVNKIGARIKLAEYSPIPGTEEFQKASLICPEVVCEPLTHNKSTFTIKGMGIEYNCLEGIKSMAKHLNAGLESTCVV